jgi:hypothetical protein
MVVGMGAANKKAKNLQKVHFLVSLVSSLLSTFWPWLLFGSRQPGLGTSFGVAAVVRAY